MEQEDNNIHNTNTKNNYVKYAMLLMVVAACGLYAYANAVKPIVYRRKKVTYYRYFHHDDYNAAPQKVNVNVNDYKHGGVLRDEKERYLPQHTYACVQDFIKYYVNLFVANRGSQLNDNNIRDEIFMMAKNSANEFARYYNTQHGSDMVARARTVRQCVIEYLLTFNAFTTANYTKKANEKMTFRSCLLHALYEHKTNLYIPLTVDLAMLHLVRAAYVDAKGTKGNLEEISHDYIASALAQIAYDPCIEQAIHLRSAQQKITFLNKMELSNYTMNIMMEHIIFNAQTHKVHEYTGHVAIINLLSYTNYITTLLIASIKDNSALDAVTYISKIKRLGASVQIVNIFDTFADLARNAKRAQTEADRERILKRLHEYCVGRALLTHKHTEIITTLLQDMKQLSQLDKHIITQLIMHNINVKLSTTAHNMLCRIWQLERDLLHEYVSCYKLDKLASRNSKNLYEYTRAVFYTTFSDMSEQAQQQLETLKSYNIPQNLRAILEALDADNRTKLYNTKKEHKDAFAQGFSAAHMHLVLTLIGAK